jgi:hypothetical protein
LNIFRRAVIITGCARAGTTLALRVFCRDLTPDEERAGSGPNEPQPFTNTVMAGDQARASELLRQALRNRHRVVKSPHASVLMPSLDPGYRVIAIFRDLRLLIPSMMRHPHTPKTEIAPDPYWTKYSGTVASPDAVERARQAAEFFYESILRYKGPMEVWSYGAWEGWRVRNRDIQKLYGRRGETSQRVLDDVRSGQLFSDRSFSFDVWRDFCDEHRVPASRRKAVDETNERLAQAYRGRGFTLALVPSPRAPENIHG